MMQTDELLLSINKLNDPDTSERRAAAEALADADERALYPLIKALQDRNPGVQDAARRSIISIGGEAAAYMALSLLREGPYLRNTALVILRELGGATASFLRSLIRDKDEDVRKFALDLIVEIKKCDYPDEIVRTLDADPNPNVRASAAKALGVIGCGAAVKHQISALHDEEWVCFSALEAIGEIKDHAAAGPVGALLNSPSMAVRHAALEALGRIGSPGTAGVILDHMKKAAGVEKFVAIKSLIELGAIGLTADISGSLVEMFINSGWEDRIAALNGLADLGLASAIPVVIDIAGGLDPSDPKGEALLFAVKDALMKFGCAAELIDTLGDPSIRFRGR